MPSISVKKAGTWHPLVDFWVHSGGAWRRVQKGYRKVSGTWQLVYGTSGAPAPPPPPGPGMLAVSIDPSEFSRFYPSAAVGGNFAQSFVPAVTGAAGAVSGTWTKTDTSPVFATSSVSGQTLTLSSFWPRRATRSYVETWRYDAIDAGSSSTGYATVNIDVQVDGGVIDGEYR